MKTSADDLTTKDWIDFESVFNQYYQSLCLYVYKLSGDESLSKDIVQEVFINLWEKRDHLVISSSIKNYLLRSCYNGYLKHLRSRKVVITRLDTMKYEMLSELNEETEGLQTEKIKALTKAIDQLPPKCKEVFMLHKFDKVKYKEIASRLGISIKTVENHISKALLHLRNSVSVILFLILRLFSDHL